jgi:predicted ATP-grasp superfamily ATP-dependent carboligase
MQTVIVLGASARAAAFSIRRAGYQPHAIDSFADRDLAAICTAVKIRRYPHEFLGSLAAAPHAPWLYTGGLENHPRLVDQLAELRPLLGNRGDVLRRARDPQRLAVAVKDAGCSLPLLGATSGMRSSARAQWLVKPRRSSGGLAIRFASEKEIAKPPRGTYVQQFIGGEAASAVFVAAANRAVLLGVTRQLVGRDFGHDRPFLYVGSIGPLVLRASEAVKLNRLGQVLAERFGLVGLFNVDFVRTVDGLWPVEVNPRYSASIEVLERALDRRFIEWHVEASKRNTLPSAAPAINGHYSGKATVYARQKGRITGDFEELVRKWNLRGGPPGIADIPRAGECFAPGQPVVTVLYDGSSMDEVDAELRWRVAAVESTLEAI